MAESYAGITVPEGEPGTIRDAAQTFTRVACGLEALEDQTAAQVQAFGGVKQLSIAAQVQLGQDVIKVDSDGDGTPDRNLEWDLDHDGTISADEREITERDLYDAGLGTAEAANDGITSLYDVQYEGKHPPDIDDLGLPGGLDSDNPNTFEKVWNWPFGPNDDQDVVRSSEDGTTGKKLVWDLDQDGKIEQSERTITERDLYDATLGIQ